MSSAVVRKSVTDLTRRKARAAFTVLTLALAVASIGIFAVPGVMQQAMDREVAANRLADLTVTMKPLDLRAADLAALERVPNVAAVEPRITFTTRVLVGDAARRGEADRRARLRTPARGRRRDRQGRAAPRRRARRGGQRPQGRLRRLRGADRHRRRVGAQRARQRRGADARRDPRSGTSRRSTRRAETVAAIAGADGYTSLSFRLRRPQPRGCRADSRGGARAAARDDRVRGVRRPAGDPRAGQLPRQVGLRGDGEHPERRHAARAGLGAGAAVEHDDDAGRRADRRRSPR